MRFLLVYCHPVPDSFAGALRATTERVVRAAGHDLRTIDLYADGFDPVLSRVERERYLGDGSANAAAVASHVEALAWAEALVFVFPIWFYGPPAMLKGWLERVWLPGVAFEIPRYKGDRARGKLQNIRLMVVITSSGSPWWWLKLIRDPARNLFVRGLRVLFAKRCRVEWLQLYNMNNASDDDRRRFVAQVERRVGALCQAG
jgi:putative NADPH-quinone reductase